MKFSVIVPVYNVSEYLKVCIDSILAQNGTDYEIILVDDGSADDSGMLCDSYAEKYDHIRAFHKTNGGLSEARNYGIEKAAGDYLIFIDSDDWIEPGCFAAFADVISQELPEVLLTRIIESFDDRDVYRDRAMSERLENPVTQQQALEWLLKYSENTWPAPLKIVSKDFVDHYGHRFLKDRLHEDVDWTCRICYTAQKYAFCDHDWYHHRMHREGSITGDINEKKICDVIEIALMHRSYYEEHQTQVNRMVFERIMNSVFYTLTQVNRCSENDKQIIFDLIRNNMSLFSFAPRLHHKLFVLLMKLLGVKNAFILWGLISGKNGDTK